MYDFHIKEFLRVTHDGKKVSFWNDANENVVDKVFKYHLLPMQSARTRCGFGLVVGSCFRPKRWEKERGRSGASQHCFEGKGATDIYPVSAYRNKEGFLTLLEALKKTGYKRICFYPKSHFIHCDYKDSKERFYVNTKDGWQQAGEEGVKEVIKISLLQ